METMVCGHDLEKTKRKCGFSDGVCVGSRGRSGGIGFWWKDVNVWPIEWSQNFFLAEIRDENNAILWVAVGVYGWPENEHKHRTWSMLRGIKARYDQPMLFFGDFNEILSAAKKVGGAPRRESCLDNFRSTIDDCCLRDLGHDGDPFTWQRGKSEANIILERLDRFLATDSWVELFPNFRVTHFPRTNSDHSLISLNTEGGHQERVMGRRRYHFKFESFWVENEECEAIIQTHWNRSMGEPWNKVADCA
ncbi:hypothetical protein RND81_01G085400 [Saponaria officinalis]|uniref:Endonuclease/exonuclease/phosphatase domain-containing protein n=1 Tax=Saponaria officinalis TaxID=3572 RepID=A0AAW1NE01_SAPOF